MSEELVIRNDISLGTIQANSPQELVASATGAAETLAAVIESQKLYVTLQGRRFVRCEGWTTLAAMLGTMPREVGVEEMDGIYVATVELVRVADGMVLTRASAECGAPDELDRQGNPTWSARPRYARRSMAITRATAKACRIAFSWVVTLAGFEPTPAEEMESVVTIDAKPAVDPPRRAGKQQQQPAATPSTELESWTGTIAAIDTKQGESRGKPWTLYIVRGADGTDFGTFSETDADLARSVMAAGEECTIHWEPTKKGSRNIVSIDALPF